MLDKSVLEKTYRELIKLPIDGRILVTLEELETVPILMKQMQVSFALSLKRFRTDDELIALPLVRPEPNPRVVALIRIFWTAHPSEISRSAFVIDPELSSCWQIANARSGELNAFCFALSRSSLEALMSRSRKAFAKASPRRPRLSSGMMTNRQGV